MNAARKDLETNADGLRRFFPLPRRDRRSPRFPRTDPTLGRPDCIHRQVDELAELLRPAVIAIRSLVHRKPPQSNLYLTVACPGDTKPTASQLLGLLKQCGAAARLKRFDETPQAIEATFLVDFREVGNLDRFGQQLRQLHPAVRLSCLDDGAAGV